MTFLSRMHQLRTPWMAWWLALALVVAPALGRMHEVLHAPVLPHTQAQPGDEAGHALFAEHSVLECLAFDQLNLGCDQPLPLALHPHGQPHAVPVWCPAAGAWPVARAGFDARAPPHMPV